MLFLLVLSSVIRMGAAQGMSTCPKNCTYFSYCTKTVAGDCSYPSEVCCDLDDLDADPGIPNPTTSTSDCGIRNKAPVAPGSIVDYKIDADSPVDTRTSFGEFPWMVAVLNGSGQEFLCGGSIIYPNIILTTAHTVSGYLATELKVKAGIWNTTDVAEQSRHQEKGVAQVVVHPEYNRQMVTNDIALLLLDDPLTLSDNVAPVCLPSDQQPVNQSTCVATGWGAGNYGNPSINSVLQKADLPLMDFDTCQNRLQGTQLGPSFKLHNSFLCADGTKQDTCKGDGGGPLMCATVADSSRYVQIGITAWGVGCRQGPSVYTSTTALLDWIQTQANALSGSS